MIIKPLAFALLVSIPAACETSDTVISLGGPDACGAGSLQGLVGREVAILQTMKFEGPFRLIRPGEAVTMDYNPERLNIDLDATDVISAVRCG
jgi:hypothetical protein